MLDFDVIWTGTMMAVCHELPVLPLDRSVPPHVLQRRGAISFSSGSALFSSLPRFERRGGISFDRADKTALYVRMLGDVIVHGKLVTTEPGLIRRGSVPENEYKTPEILPTNQIRRTSLRTTTPTAVVSAPLPASPARQTSTNQAKPKRQLMNPTVLTDSLYHGQAQQMLQSIGSWDFNIFQFDTVTKGHSLRLVLAHLFEIYGLQKHFKLDSYKLLRSFEIIEEGYYSKSKNPYHNSMHAADVCQAMHCYLQEEKLKEVLTPLEVMGALFGSAMHDLDHPGVNQKYLINSKHHLADLYQNSSVLENHHWRASISLLRETGLLDHLPPDQWKQFVDHIRSLILATDIARQQEFLSEFQVHLSNKSFSLKNHESRKFIMQIALKCADICNPCRTWQITQKWGNVVSEEFFRQGDREKRTNLPISMNCDRVTTTVSQIQCGFIGFVVEPLFSNWADFLPTNLSSQMLGNMKKNKKEWTERREKEKEKEKAAQAANQSDAIQTSTNNKDSIAKPAEVPQEKLDTPPHRTVEERSTEKSEDVAEPETKSLKRDTTEGSVDMETEPISVQKAEKQVQSAIASLSQAVETHAHTHPGSRPPSVTSPPLQRPHSAHKSLDVTWSDSTAVGVHSKTGNKDILHGSKPDSAVRMRPAETRRGGARLSLTNKRTQSATESTLHESYRARRLESFSLRLPPSPNIARKTLSFDDPWEKQDISPHSPVGNPHSPLSSPRDSLDSPKMQRANHPMRYSHTSPLLADGDLQSIPGHVSAYPELGHGLNNNLDFPIAMDPSKVSLLHQNMSHNKQHDRSEVPHWQERGLHLYSEQQNSIIQSNSKQFIKSISSPGGIHRDSGMPASDQRTKATPRSLLVSPDVARSSLRREPLSPQNYHSRRRGVHTSLQVPGEHLGREGIREMGSPFIQKRMQQRDRRKELDVPSAVITTASLSPRVPPRGASNIYSSSAPHPAHTPTSPPPYSVPPALGPLFHDFTSDQLALIARRKQHMREGEPAQAAGTPLGDRSPRLPRQGRGGGDGGAQYSQGSQHDSGDLAR